VDDDLLRSGPLIAAGPLRKPLSRIANGPCLQRAKAGMSKKTYLTPPEIAAQFGVSPSKVIGWINRGELVAFNSAERTGGRSRWRGSQAELDAFILRRSSQPLGRRVIDLKHRLPQVTEYF
jgi:predicted DNA-binding transcriptional regulator AlpA